MYNLETDYRKIADFHRLWMDKVAAVTVKKNTTIEQLQTATERKKELQE